jgi:lipopolysaccharide transport system permease protein
VTGVHGQSTDRVATNEPVPLDRGLQSPLVTIIRARPGWQAIDLPAIWRFRELVLTLASRDLKLRYKQTALGVIWVVLQPLAAAGVFSFVFGTVAKLSSEGVPYFVYSFAGILGWNLFSGTLTKASTSLVGNAHLISKVYFPRLILPLSTIPSVLVDFSVALLMLIAAMIARSVHPGWSVLMMPLSMLMLLMLALGIGLVGAALSVSYRDVQYIVPVALQIVLYASPVAYAVSAVPEHLRRWYRLNPVCAPIEAFRASILNTAMPPTESLLYAAVACVVVLAAGLYTFKAMERKFADVI